MNTVQFPGCAKLIETIDTAMSKGSARAITDYLRQGLCRLMHDDEVTLPASVYETVNGRYARRQLHQSAAHGYCVVAMTWGPGQGTPIHDHCGMWCVEGVWHGALEVVQYQRLEDQEDRPRFQPVGSILAGYGSAGSLIPPHEYHTIRNPSDDGVAVSLHIYAGPMTSCAVFQPTGDERCYVRSERILQLDPLSGAGSVRA